MVFPARFVLLVRFLLENCSDSLLLLLMNKQAFRWGKLLSSMRGAARERGSCVACACVCLCA